MAPSSSLPKLREFAKKNDLCSQSGQNLFGIPQKEMDVCELGQVDLLVLPGCVQFLPLGEDRGRFGLDLGAGRMVLGGHGFA